MFSVYGLVMPGRYGLTEQEIALVERGPRRLMVGWLILSYASQQEQGVTCDESLRALALDHSTDSPTFSGLVAAGVLVKTGRKRRTATARIGGHAHVYAVSESADFRHFIQGKTTVKNANKAILVAAKRFLDQWGATATPDRHRLVTELVTSLLATRQRRATPEKSKSDEH